MNAATLQSCVRPPRATAKVQKRFAGHRAPGKLSRRPWRSRWNIEVNDDERKSERS